MEQIPIFNPDKMKRLVNSDKYLQLIFKDLTTRNIDELNALQVIFNSNVLDGFDYLKAYQNA